jgi:sugar phosphate isomerase/epimerase
MEDLIAELDFSVVDLMLDVGHATKDSVELPPERRALSFLEKYWSQVHYLELKDWNETSDLNTQLGEGYTDYPGIFNLMSSQGYYGWLTVEQNGNDGWRLGRSPLECAKISRNFIREHLGA